MKEIPLTKGKVALVDDEDYEWLSKNKWCYTKTGYANRKRFIYDTPGPYTLTMHRAIMEYYNYKIDGLTIDHINGNGLDNRKSNLRIATHAQNIRNSRRHFDNTSGYKGVSWSKYHKEWEVYISVNNKRISLGRRENLIEAAKLYDKGAIKYFGEFANLNFPDDKPIDLEIRFKDKITGKSNTSGFRGVSFAKKANVWVTDFQHNQRRYKAGPFDNPVDAAIAYNELALKHLGEKAKLNIIPEKVR